jgi:hypothetical protein
MSGSTARDEFTAKSDSLRSGRNRRALRLICILRNNILAESALSTSPPSETGRTGKRLIDRGCEILWICVETHVLCGDADRGKCVSNFGDFGSVPSSGAERLLSHKLGHRVSREQMGKLRK